MKNKLFFLPITLLILLSTLLSCSNEKTYIDPNVQYIDYVDKNEKLPEPFDKIKVDYYQQIFVDKGIYKMSQLKGQNFVDEAMIVTTPDQFITINSFYLRNFYGVLDGYYFLNFSINHAPAASWFMSIEFEYEEYELNNNGFGIEPILWKDGRILTMKAAIETKAINFDVFYAGENDDFSGKKIISLTNYFKPRPYVELVSEYGGEEKLDWNIILSKPTDGIYYKIQDQYLPPVIE